MQAVFKSIQYSTREINSAPRSQTSDCQERNNSFSGYQLIGPGACRGQNWGDGEWPVAAGDKTLEGCSKKCHEIEICTSFSLGKGDKAKKPCMLYSHEDIQPASSLGGECYKIAAGMFYVSF